MGVFVYREGVLVLSVLAGARTQALAYEFHLVSRTSKDVSICPS